MELKFTHKELSYIVEGALKEGKISMSLTAGERKFARTLIYDEFPDEVKKAFGCVEDVFQVMEEKKNLVVEIETGTVVILVRVLKKNTLI